MPHIGFDQKRYEKAQKEALLERFNKFPKGKFYLEIGGKFLFDRHAASVLPGFDPETKIRILQKLGAKFDIIFCINSVDIVKDRVWEEGRTYYQSVKHFLKELSYKKFEKPIIAVNLYKGQEKAKNIGELLKKEGYKVYFKRFIDSYPNDVGKILGPEGYGKDDYIETKSRFIVVIGLGSNSGKMSVCFSQLYLDKVRNLESGYAKYETFPIWGLTTEHPVNLAYEAATVDIGDYNAFDTFHFKAYGEKVINYNRDLEGFPILSEIGKMSKDHNFLKTYKSPTDMGVNFAKEGIIDDKIISEASITEIKNRIKSFTNLYNSGLGKKKWIIDCEKILAKAQSYLNNLSK